MNESQLQALATAISAKNEAAKAAARWKEDIDWCGERIKRSEKRLAAATEALAKAEAEVKALLAVKPEPAPATPAPAKAGK